VKVDELELEEEEEEDDEEEEALVSPSLERGSLSKVEEEEEDKAWTRARPRLKAVATV
jgi:hypothetical protein